jgi:outer membrane protein assembly factor BamB
MKQLLLCTQILAALASSAQEVFFQSKQSFTQKQQASFFSAIALQDSLLLFNAGDYHLYAYDKNTGQQKWVYFLGRKSNVGPYFAGNYIWANTNESEAVQLSLTGTKVRELPFSLLTQPLVRGNILYATGIYNVGSIVAYDIAADSVLWDRFLAHGCSRQPYYFADKVIANAEADAWLEMNYDGKLKTDDCQSEEHRFPSELSCAEHFAALTHDNKRIDGHLAVKLYADSDNQRDVFTTAKNTFILAGGQLSILGNRLKKLSTETVYSLAGEIEMDEYSTTKILAADAATVWMLYNNKLIAYNYKKHSMVKMTDLEKWDPHQALLDGNRLWLISKKDGLLYGLTL